MRDHRAGADVKRLIAGTALGVAAAAAFSASGSLVVSRCSRGGGGTGSDAAGDYNYDWLQVHLLGWSVQLHWWPQQ